MASRLNQKSNVKEVEKLLNRFDEIWNKSIKTQLYPNSAEMTNISKKLTSMKLRDDFLVTDLTEKQKDILDRALIIASVTR